MSAERLETIAPENGAQMLGQPALADVMPPEAAELPAVALSSLEATALPTIPFEEPTEPTGRPGRRTPAESSAPDEPVVLITDDLPLQAWINLSFLGTILSEAASYRNPQRDPQVTARRANGVLTRATILCLMPLPGIAIRGLLAYAAWAAINPQDAVAQIVNPIKTLAQIGGDRIAAWRAGERGKEVREERKEARRLTAYQKQVADFQKAHADEIEAWAKKYHVTEDEATSHLMQKEFVETNRERILELFKLFEPKTFEEVRQTLLQMVQDEIDEKMELQALRSALRIPEALLIGLGLGVGTLLLGELIPLALVGFAAMLLFPIIMRVVIPHLEAGYDRARERYLKDHPQVEEEH